MSFFAKPFFTVIFFQKILRDLIRAVTNHTALLFQKYFRWNGLWHISPNKTARKSGDCSRNCNSVSTCIYLQRSRNDRSKTQEILAIGTKMQMPARSTHKHNNKPDKQDKFKNNNFCKLLISFGLLIRTYKQTRNQCGTELPSFGVSDFDVRLLVPSKKNSIGA